MHNIYHDKIAHYGAILRDDDRHRLVARLEMPPSDSYLDVYGLCADTR
jgi:hypothetical protein